ncbi:MAG: PorP/SprF family type IX secretion system membrane protein [Bacteroidia bacterium]|nr:PorP/SprF family type IX secretion system membrane protein [Bacteroidia bacterium]
MSKKICFLSFAFLIFTKSFSQDPFFINTDQSIIYLNPSFAGSNGGIRNQFTYRNQWPNTSGNYVTFVNSLDFYLPKVKGGISVLALHDDQAHGTLKTEKLSLGYAQQLSLFDGKLKLIPSLQLSYFEKNLDTRKLNFGSYINPRRGFAWSPYTIPNTKKQNIDFSAGLLSNYKNFYLGTAIFHINQPDEGLLGVSKLPYRLLIHSSYNLHVSEKTVFNLFARFEKQQNFEGLSLNMKALLFKHLILGAGCTSDNLANFNFGYRNNFFVVSLGYDMSKFRLLDNYTGSWEFMASFNLRNKEQRKTLTDFEKW